ncbi:hypothetical protein [Ferruginibacter sp.]
MDHLVTSYLFQHKQCPLPGLGTLAISTGNAEGDFLNTAIKAPLPDISFNTNETEANDLLQYIAVKTGNDITAAIEMLGNFCNALRSAINDKQAAVLKGAGEFFKDGSGNIKFKANALPAAFAQPVRAERVIHPKAEHNMLVGDRETTTAVMTEYYNEEPIKKDRWWIWAIVIAVIALVAILLYMNSDNIAAMFGNTQSI